MSKFVDRPRYLCALGGAIATLKCLPRAISIIHAAAGCGGNVANALNGATGYMGSGYCAGQALPSSNVGENEIVFGGENRLTEQIENTLKLIDGDLYVVVTGCMVEMIGDDVQSVVKKFVGHPVPVLAAETGGFKGNSFKGYDIILQLLFQEFVLPAPDKDPKLLNLWGIVPVQDVFWKGNLAVLKTLLEKLGYRVNTFFGEDETLDNLRNAGAAVLNIVVSDTAGVEPARVFEEKLGTPFIIAPFPIGAYGTEEFLRTVGQALGIEEVFVNKLIKQEKEHFYGYLERLADVYNDLDLQRYAVIVADANYAQALTRFLADDLGWLPELVVVTDLLNEDQQKQVATRFGNYLSPLKPKLVFDSNTSSVKKHLFHHWPVNHNQRYYDGFNPAFIIGSAFERDLAENLGIPHLSVTYPISNRVVLDRAYAGYSGALRLTEDLLGTLVGGR
jgi:Nitrogenase molybdenum-iron protein, alpha and beta chains